MRIQFVPFPAASHFTQMVPLAWACQTAGHDVRFVVPPNFVDTVTRTGLVAVPYGIPIDPTDGDHVLPGVDDLATLSGLDGDGSPEDDHVRRLALGTLIVYFGLDVLESTVADLVELTQAWAPDLVVWDTLCFQASVAARVAGAASARLIWGIDHIARMRAAFQERAAGAGEEVVDDVAGMMSATLDRHGSSFAEEVVLGDWTINPLPVVVPDPPGLPCVNVRQLSFNHVTEVPPWVLERPDRPRVCLTLGRSVRDVRNSDNFGISIEDLLLAVADLDVEVVATLTADQLPAAAKVPDNVRLVDFVPMNQLLPTCSAVIHHAGTSTMMSALWYGVPQVIVAAFTWDEPEVAQVVADYGAGLRILAAELTPVRLREALVRVLAEPGFAEGTRRLRDATRCAPSPNEAVAVLERLTRASGSGAGTPRNP